MVKGRVGTQPKKAGARGEEWKTGKQGDEWMAGEVVAKWTLQFEKEPLKSSEEGYDLITAKMRSPSVEKVCFLI